MVLKKFGYSRKKGKIFVLTFFISTEVIWSSNTMADTSNQINSLERITVTATQDEFQVDRPAKSYVGGQFNQGGRIGVFGDTKTLDTPFNVYGYTEKFIKDQQSKTLSDILENDASSSVGLAAGEYAEVFKIRGFTLLGDDISYGGLYGVLPRKIINTNLFENIEIFKGASAFTNGVPGGGSGVGGAVNAEPKRAKDIPITQFNLGVENKDYKNIQMDIARRYGKENEFGFRVSGNHGFGELAVKDTNKNNSSLIFGFDYKGINNRASIDIGYQKDYTKKGLMALGLKDPDGPGWGVNYEGLEVPKVPKSNQNYSPYWGFGSEESTFGMLRGEHDFSDVWMGYAAIGGSKSEEKTREASVDIINFEGDASTGQHLIHQKRTNLASQFGLRGKFNTGKISHKVNLAYSSVFTKVGMGMIESEEEYLTNIYSPNKELDYVGEKSFIDVEETPLTQRIRNQGISLSNELGFLNDKLLITIGARYQKIENYNYSNEKETNSYKETSITPIYGSVYKINEKLSLYANYIEALQPASNAPLDTKSNRDKGLNLDNWGQSPGVTRSKQNEIGLNFDFGVLGGSFGVFQIIQPQAIVNIEGTHFDFYNEQRNRGVEFNIYGAPKEEIRLYSSLMIMDSKLTKVEEVKFQGKKAVGNPNYKFVVGGEWDIPYLNNLTATARYISNGSQYINQINNLKLSSWNRLDLGFRFKTVPFDKLNVTWRANVENVMNKSYWESAATDGNSRITIANPRTLKVSATFDF